MIILGVDCSSKQSSVAIMQDEQPLYQVVQNAGMTHSQNLLPMIDHALQTCGLNKNQIDLFAVTVGPGSFTGLRIGIALIKSMAMALNKPCVGISSLQALAASTSFDGITIPCFDARRNQLYCNITDETQIIQPDDCCLVEDLQDFIANCQKNIFFVGDGKDLCYNKYENFSKVKKHDVLMPCIAYGACKLALHAPLDTHFNLTPSYLRLSQAERELKEKQK